MHFRKMQSDGDVSRKVTTTKISATSPPQANLGNTTGKCHWKESQNYAESEVLIYKVLLQKNTLEYWKTSFGTLLVRMLKTHNPSMIILLMSSLTSKYTLYRCHVHMSVKTESVWIKIEY